MNIIIGLIPAFIWGFQPLAVNKIGGSPFNQVFGTTFTTFLAASLLFAFHRQTLPLEGAFICFLSGFSFAIGQVLQYASYRELPVSKALPISTGMQLVGNSLASIIFFGEWRGIPAKIAGFTALGLIISGVLLTSYTEKKAAVSTNSKQENMKKAIILLIFSSIGLVGYSALPRVAEASGWVKFFPQACGMIAASLVITAAGTKGTTLKEGKSYQNMLTGLIFSAAALMYLVSTSINGAATGFALSQMMVIIATISSIFLLHEKKTRKEMAAVIAGLILVAGGGVLIGIGT